MNKQILKDAGLTEGEIKVYLALLELGDTTTGPLVDKSGVARSIVYQILERLIEKGLASYIVKDKTKYYQAADPNKLLDYAQKRKEEIDNNVKEIEKILPDLLSKKKLKDTSSAKIYFGMKGIRTAHEGTYRLKKGESFYYLGIPASQPEEQHIYWKKDHLRRIKAGIKSQVLFNRDTDPEIMKNRNSFKGCDARYMPKGITTPASFLIYKDTVVISVQDPQQIAVEIRNQDIKDSFQAYFDNFWKKSTKLKK
ncbi:hypothetical protein ISS08_00410 [Candidatus Pacearchaeota archaeon]|nr:hypothetical protein [Candidatus Pacearchaeota archaeon]